MRTFEVTINGKKYLFQSRTIKGAMRKVRVLASKILKMREVK